jgi:hypothetical protein
MSLPNLLSLPLSLPLTQSTSSNNQPKELVLDNDIIKYRILPFLTDAEQLNYTSTYNTHVRKFNKTNPIIPKKYFIPKTLHDYYSYQNRFPNDINHSEFTRKAISKVYITDTVDTNSIQDFKTTNIKSIDYFPSNALPINVSTNKLNKLEIHEDIDIDNIRFCPNLMSLTIHLSENHRNANDLFTHSLDNIVYCTKLKHFHSFREITNQIDILGNCSELECIQLTRFNQSIDFLAECLYMKYIYINNLFNQPIDALGSCRFIKRFYTAALIDISNKDYERELSNIIIYDYPRSTKANFNQPIDVMYYWNELEILSLGDQFDQPIDALEYCPKLRILAFGVDFNQPIDALKGCTQLEQLSFDRISISPRNSDYEPEVRWTHGLFNQSIEVLSNCKKLKKLFFSSYFNQPINALVSCKQLDTLVFGPMFDQPIDILVECDQLKILVLDQDFNQPIDTLPKFQSLITIRLGRSFNQNLKPLSLCRKLKNIVLPTGYEEFEERLKRVLGDIQIGFI